MPLISWRDAYQIYLRTFLCSYVKFRSHISRTFAWCMHINICHGLCNVHYVFSTQKYFLLRTITLKCVPS